MFRFYFAREVATMVILIPVAYGAITFGDRILNHLKLPSLLGRSRDCDELAQKILRASFESAPQNEGSYFKYLNVPYNAYSKQYTIDARGEITVEKKYHINVYGQKVLVDEDKGPDEIPEYAKPTVDTATSLVCPSIQLPQYFFGILVFGSNANSIKASEDNGQLYWTEPKQ